MTDKDLDFSGCTVETVRSGGKSSRIKLTLGDTTGGRYTVGMAPVQIGDFIAHLLRQCKRIGEAPAGIVRPENKHSAPVSALGVAPGAKPDEILVQLWFGSTPVVLTLDPDRAKFLLDGLQEALEHSKGPRPPTTKH
jgi:hypothetical protein